MHQNSPSTDQWKKLYVLMDEIKKISPWEWLSEQDMFIVEHPDTKELGFVSVMGAMGEHYSIAVYRGKESVAKLFYFQDNYVEGDDNAFEKLIEISQLQASFEDRDLLSKEERQMIKNLGLTYKGKDSWPMFRRYDPGYVPWYIDADDAGFLIYALQQTIEVSQRASDNPELLYPDDGNAFLYRSRTKKGSKEEWKDSIWQEPLNEEVQIQLALDKRLIEKIQTLSSENTEVEMDIFMSPHAVGEEGERPYYPYILLILDSKTGMIRTFEMTSPVPDLNSMWEKLPDTVANILINSSFLPEQIYVEKEILYHSLNMLSNHVNLSVNYVENLIMMPEARSMYKDFSS